MIDNTERHSLARAIAHSDPGDWAVADAVIAWMREHDYEKREPARDPYAECMCGHGRSTHVHYAGACGLCTCVAVRGYRPDAATVARGARAFCEYANIKSPSTGKIASNPEAEEAVRIILTAALTSDGERAEREPIVVGDATLTTIREMRAESGRHSAHEIAALDLVLAALTPDGQEGPWVDPLPWVYYDGTRRAENPYPEGSANPYRVLWTYSPRLTPDGQEATP